MVTSIEELNWEGFERLYPIRRRGNGGGVLLGVDKWLHGQDRSLGVVCLILSTQVLLCSMSLNPNSAMH